MIKCEVASEPVAQRCSVKKAFLEISQNLQESTCARVYFLIKLQAFKVNNNDTRMTPMALVFSCEFCEISKNTFSYRIPLVVLVTSDDIINKRNRRKICSCIFMLTKLNITEN